MVVGRLLLLSVKAFGVRSYPPVDSPEGSVLAACARLLWPSGYDWIAQVSDAGRTDGDSVAWVEELLRCAADTGAACCAGAHQVARLQRHSAGKKLEKRWDGIDHGVGGGPLFVHTVHAGAELERMHVDIGHLVRAHDVRAEGAERVRTLAQRDLQRFALHHVARADVVDHRVAEDVFVGTLGGHPLGARAADVSPSG